eukprot:CAMPEP_0113312072 /NCGR_PEP_ID=MMETSP0010_2-20120614/9043_1 /TAXON_ID=216773 ORGANISM="Corethron hystrix, Strain 308" /NCGR_SAMPLE_ID=MMETSP0010_2 /ASSEMBLY_ACC=CAM_ASM_000155 /LENGTH=543 /DNA_ID=CAMNT_0000167813 /DNA_START=90 /DNA_END=1718 /DNA_ORIENTATION=- /assembly_acc=CAM_ASM_000155
MKFSFVLALIATLSSVQGQIITDFNVHSRDITPVVGRGYSTITGKFYTSCMSVETEQDTTVDFDVFFTEYTDSSDAAAALSGKIRQYASYDIVRDRIYGLLGSNTSPIESTWNGQAMHMLTLTMAIDRYFETIEDDGDTEIDEDALDMLETGGILEFFHACGPYYVNSLRKSSEITSMYTYYSPNMKGNVMYNYAIKQRLMGYQATRRAFAFDTNALIETVAYGLDIGAAGGILAYDSYDDFHMVMETAFESFKNPSCGVVRQIELVPYTTQDDFELAVRTARIIDVPTLDARGRQRYSRNGKEDLACNTEIEEKCTIVDGTRLKRASYTCIATCADGCNPLSTCTPMMGASYSLEMRRFNLIQNGDFLLQIDLNLRNEYLFLNKFQNCLQALMEMGDSEDQKELINKSDFTTSATVEQLRMRLAFGTVCPDSSSCSLSANTNYNNSAGYLLTQYRLHVMRYANLYVTPCLLELQGDYMGIFGGNMQFAHWTEYPACNKFECALPGHYWPPSATTCTNNTASMNSLQATVDQYCMPNLRSIVG